MTKRVLKLFEQTREITALALSLYKIQCAHGNIQINFT